MQPLVLDYLKAHTLEQLKAEHAVNFRWSSDARKVSLNYDTIASKPGNRIAEECRGLVLGVPPVDGGSRSEPYPGLRVLCWPLSRFYNHGDPSAAKVDWSDDGLVVCEKLDGTMIAVYHDGEKWCAATRAVPEADLPIHGDHLDIGNITFAELFWQTMAAQDMPLRPESTIINTDLTLVFELTSPFNRVVVEYAEPRVTLIAIRNRRTGQEIHPHRTVPFWPLPKTWPLRDAGAIAAFVGASDPLTLEGAVVVDSKFRRVKMKSAAWVALSGGKAAVLASRRSALSAVILGLVDDVIPLVDARTAKKLTDMQAAFAEYCKYVDEKFTKWRDAAPDRKAFAGLVMGSNEWPGIYFGLLDKRGPDALSMLAEQCAKGRLTDTAKDSILAQLFPAEVSK